jgi:hypothetical protein
MRRAHFRLVRLVLSAEASAREAVATVDLAALLDRSAVAIAIGALD